MESLGKIIGTYGSSRTKSQATPNPAIYQLAKVRLKADGQHLFCGQSEKAIEHAVHNAGGNVLLPLLLPRQTLCRVANA